ncbi:enoyl-CoA hydratase/isomerase family protein [Henriciella mobilis]|uniref:enoyl-CoA hydratase/isomerase family protein n=1 Tax=Henriciella mobilis TaxID=2305467 RepID=UPI000E66064F|nr:enoyl-CoA hydratase/isomerase family protein [Henriciella mobilis]RIJ14463.1 enoyl-CoA hydratase/isomerase family protein [Henriciella mobilis]RIJ19710.1 enoyl-CoA hydratase/isomerase family protein [Henriciella mobilis]
MTIDIKKADGVWTLTFNRPDRMNAINEPMSVELLDFFEGLRRNQDVRVIIVTGEGRAFNAGADLKAIGTPDALRDGPKGDWRLRDTIKAMRACPQPIISLVNGAAAGGGLALALASDIIIASTKASFVPAFIKIGLSGSELGVSWRLQRTMGISKAREFLFTSRPMSAEQALENGIVSAVVEPDELIAYGDQLAADMLQAAPDALRVTKRTLDAALEMADPALLMELEERSQSSFVRRNIRGRAG